MARNSDVSPYIGKFSRSKLFAKKGLYKRSYDTAPAAPAEGKEAAPAFYPADGVRKPKASRKTVKPASFRSSLSVGSVVILLAGKFRGKRAVVTAQLPSGLLVVTGPFKINGIPLKRVNPAYVIGTSTKVDLSGLDVAKFDDAYFTKPKKAARATEGEFFGEGKEKKTLPADRVQDQKTVDAAVLKAVASTPNLAKYLAATFGLSKGEYPHLLKF
ncbi:hypothetical protein JCM10207_003839 [Rhodosporidiobolus poonsookiae]